MKVVMLVSKAAALNPVIVRESEWLSDDCNIVVLDCNRDEGLRPLIRSIPGRL